MRDEEKNLYCHHIGNGINSASILLQVYERTKNLDRYQEKISQEKKSFLARIETLKKEVNFPNCSEDLIALIEKTISNAQINWEDPIRMRGYLNWILQTLKGLAH
ncbi:MAG: hypothetical protein HYS32_03375 [Candidatus Woesearchaeota archaeon]|nr:MAG: hypothetical protein HYS32_03375 [Candidatus Woesearchaeota archaeon]